jgi:hypothetical protein
MALTRASRLRAKRGKGKIGDLIYRLMPDGSTVVSRAPQKQKLKFSKKQKSHQNRFGEAASYARQAAEDQPIYAELAAAATMKTALQFCPVRLVARTSDPSHRAATRAHPGRGH